jgi:hypothetical protein
MLWWAADGSRPLRRCGFATHHLEAHSRGAVAGERASVTVVALPAVVLPAHRAGAPPLPPPPPFELIIGVVGYDPRTCTRYDACTCSSRRLALPTRAPGTTRRARHPVACTCSPRRHALPTGTTRRARHSRRRPPGGLRHTSPSCLGRASSTY